MQLSRLLTVSVALTEIFQMRNKSAAKPNNHCGCVAGAENQEYSNEIVCSKSIFSSTLFLSNAVIFLEI